MKAIQTGNVFNIYDNSMRTYDQLPAQAYLVCFDKMQGPFLKKYSDIEISEKVYGVHQEKVKKVFNSFKMFTRNLGVILSGDKGIGKSLFSKMLSQKAVSEGYPLLIVNSWFPGIGEYLAEIEQEVVVLFDEFDKTFNNKHDDMSSPQTEMLTLFDGVAQGKKLFVVTCNDMNSLNKFLINRPGRFHYHFRFEYPSPEEIKEYLMDKLTIENAEKEIANVISFSRKTKLNYDCLRAIAFELNLGLTFSDAVKDLNILNIEAERYDLILHLSNKETLFCKGCNFDMFGDEEISFEFEDHDTREDLFYCFFNPAFTIYSIEHQANIIEGKHLKLDWYKCITEADTRYPDDKHLLNLQKKYAGATPLFMEIKRKPTKSLHYMV